MNSAIDSTSTVDAHAVPNHQRLQMLPKHFGQHMLTIENAIYSFMRTLSSQYRGAYWNFFELSNGGFYMAPESKNMFNICVEGNGFEGEMSADAAGITACLFAFSHLSFHIDDDTIATHYYWLRDFAMDHPEVRAILAATD